MEFVEKLKQRPKRAGWKHTSETKQAISERKKGKEAHNKGKRLSGEELLRHQEVVAKREENYRKTQHPLLGRKIPLDTRGKISQSLKRYTAGNKDKIKENAQKTLLTKQQPGGYFDKKRLETTDKRETLLEGWNFQLLEYDGTNHHIKCTNCGTEFQRVSFYEMHPNMCPNCGQKKVVSDPERELATWLASLLGYSNIIRNDRSVLGNFEIDILVPDRNIGIEFNGLYWHSELAGKTRYYHRFKYLKCREKNIQLIQIFEDEWIHQMDKVKERLTSKLGLQNKIQARKTNIVVLESSIARDFLDSHHIQFAGQGGIYLGLEHESKLVAVMSFTKLSHAKGYRGENKGIFELNRYASIGNIIGGGSKLFSYFVNNFNPIEVISYSDLRWNTGSFYEKIGMKYCGDTQPNYWYIEGNKRVHRYKLRKQPDEPKDITEWDLRREQGYNRIWDCGHSRWKWER